MYAETRTALFTNMECTVRKLRKSTQFCLNEFSLKFGNTEENSNSLDSLTYRKTIPYSVGKTVLT